MVGDMDKPLRSEVDLTDGILIMFLKQKPYHPRYQNKTNDTLHAFLRRHQGECEDPLDSVIYGPMSKQVVLQ